MSIGFLLGVRGGRQRRQTTLPRAPSQDGPKRKELTRQDWEDLWEIVLPPEEFARRKAALKLRAQSTPQPADPQPADLRADQPLAES